MSIEFITLTIWLGFLVLMATGMPIAFTMIVTGALGYWFFVDANTVGSLGRVAFGALNNELFIAIPLYAVMAMIFQVSGITTRLYDVMYKWMGGLRGGLAAGTVAIATVLGATTGLVATATITMGMLAYPEMRNRGYNKTMAIGVVVGGGALGLLIPPSVTMILVGSLSGLSIGALFIAGIIPGLLCSGLFMAWCLIWSAIDPNAGPAIPKEKRANWGEKFRSIPGLLPPIAIICVVLGGIWFGVFTATEAGGIGAFTAFVYAAAIKALNKQNVKTMADSTIKITTMVLLIAVGGSIFTSVNGILGTNAFVTQLLGGLTSSPFVMMLILLGIVLVLGMIMDLLAIAMICLPIMMPIVNSLGIDTFYFGFMFAMALIVGTLSPPFGYTLFYFAGLKHKDVQMTDIYKGGWMMTLWVSIVLFICLLFPQIPTWLPSIMIKQG